MNRLYASIFNISNEQMFNEIALRTFDFQLKNCGVYSEYCHTLKKTNTPTHYAEIPFLPISFFKTHDVLERNAQSEITFSSSGTTGDIRSRHQVKNIALYESSFTKSFELHYGEPEDFCFVALLPSYIENEGSSLLYMVNQFIKKSTHPYSGYYLSHKGDLMPRLQELNDKKVPTILLGVTYALMDFSEENPLPLKNIIIMETGGMKGKRKELTKEEVHLLLKKSFGVDTIHSEYGMTELLSQAYSKGNNVFSCPPWMKILTRDTQDPFSPVAKNRAGGINVIDLANIHSCSFIETQDLGKVFDNGDFEIIGRFDHSDIRGCNLLTEL